MIPGVDMKKEEINQISPVVLAYVGDAVFELALRSYLVREDRKALKDLHNKATQMARAESQACFLKSLLEHLTEEELAVVRRGRNAKSRSFPKRTKVTEYRMSTGLEALLGYLYLKGDLERLEELLSLVWQEK